MLKLRSKEGDDSSSFPSNLAYIGEIERHGNVYKKIAPWPLKKLCKSHVSVSIISSLHPSETLTEDITVLVEKVLVRPQGESTHF